MLHLDMKKYRKLKYTHDIFFFIEQHLDARTRTSIHFRREITISSSQFFHRETIFFRIEGKKKIALECRFQ